MDLVLLFGTLVLEIYTPMGSSPLDVAWDNR